MLVVVNMSAEVALMTAEMTGRRLTGNAKAATTRHTKLSRCRHVAIFALARPFPINSQLTLIKEKGKEVIFAWFLIRWFICVAKVGGFPFNRTRREVGSAPSQQLRAVVGPLEDVRGRMRP